MPAVGLTFRILYSPGFACMTHAILVIDNIRTALLYSGSGLVWQSDCINVLPCGKLASAIIFWARSDTEQCDTDDTRNQATTNARGASCAVGE